MAGIDGLETARQIRQLDPHGRIVLITGYAVDRALKQAKKDGFEILTKPFNMVKIKEIIRQTKGQA